MVMYALTGKGEALLAAVLDRQGVAA
jgi:hypothetical protein